MKTALVIDDNRSSADMLVNFLELLEIKAHAAYSPRAALMAVRENMPGVIFLDLNMPGLSGFEVLGYLRREPGASEVPVIVVTSDDQPETAARVREMGGTRVIVKPISIEVLEEVLRTNHLLEE